MDYSEFIKEMEGQETAGKGTVSLLQEYVKEFPYFQTAQALLAKAMHDQQHVRFEKQLKLASAYMGDRKVLYKLIHPRPATLFSEKTFVNETEPEKINVDNVFVEETPVIPPTAIEENETVEIPSYNFTPVQPLYVDETEVTETDTDMDDGPMVADPHEIIRKRLNEILGLEENNIEFKPRKKDPPLEEPAMKADEKAEEKKMNDVTAEETLPILEEKSVVETPVQVNEMPVPETAEIKKDNISKIIEESVRARDVIDKGELEYALEATLIHSLEKLPVIEKEQKQEKTIPETKKELTFYDWLKKSKVSGYGKFEEVHAEDAEISETGNIDIDTKETKDDVYSEANLLIDKFIKSDPKIIPSKVEFYSPASQAKKSITEDEDLVSETLANIYRQQGNALKARSCYQKLSLLYPEKMAYFAALISEIDKDFNNQQKEDL